MNNKIINIISLALLIFNSSCEKADPIVDLDGEPGNVTESGVTLTPNEISFFDRESIDYNVFSTIGLVDNVNLVSVDPDINEVVAISNKKGVFAKSFAELGFAEIDDKINFKVIPFINNRKLDTIETSIIVINPVEVEVPSTDTIIRATSKKERSLKYEIKSLQVKDAEIKLEQKTFFDGTYAEIQGDFNPLKGSYMLKGIDYNKLDTVYFKVTATKGGISASKEEKVFIDTEYFGNPTTSILSNEFYELNTLNEVEEAKAEIKYLKGSSAVFSQIESINNNTGFVPYTGNINEIFSFGDKLEAIEVYNSGSAIKTINTEPGTLFIYKFNRLQDDKEVEYIGLIRVNSVGTTPSFNVSISTREAKI